jgi:hypothetical protein
MLYLEWQQLLYCTVDVLQPVQPAPLLVRSKVWFKVVPVWVQLRYKSSTELQVTK